eukprot:s510_g14.t1
MWHLWPLLSILLRLCAGNGGEFDCGDEPYLMLEEALRRELLAKGGLLSDWNTAVSRGLNADDVGWNDGEALGEKALDVARRSMTRGGLMEYECYNDQRRPQGRAVVVLNDWEDYAAGLVVADHLKASDPYYQWYAEQKLKGDQCAYHMCSSKLRDCAFRVGRGDRREIVHVQRWRIVNPLVMMENEYMRPLGLEIVQDFVRRFTPAERVPEPGNPPGPRGPDGPRGGDDTGLDKALEAAQAEALGGQKEPVEGAKQDLPVRLEAKGSVAALLEKRAAEHREAKRAKDAEEKRKRRERGRSRSKRRKRRDRREDSSKSSRSGAPKSEGSESSEGFRLPSSRQEDELWRLSQKHPGRLLKVAMKEMKRYLGDLSAGTGEEEDWSRYKMMGYVNQILFMRHPPSQIGVRNQREVVTLAAGVDLLLQGKLAELGDLMIQRLKALESSFSDQSWMTARHQEIIPPVGASLTGELERRQAARLELSNAKLKTLERDQPRSSETGDVQRDPKGDPKRRESRRHETERGAEARSGSQGRAERKREDKRKKSPSLLAEGSKGDPKRRRKEGEPPESDANEGTDDQESLETVLVAEDGPHLLSTLKSWLEGEECGGLSVAQNGALLALTIYRSGTPLGRYMERLVMPGSDDGPKGKRQRSLLPIPLWPDSQTELSKIFEEGEFKRLAGTWGSKKNSKEKAGKEMRRIGLLCWHGLVISFLNFLWSGRGKTSPMPPGTASKAQKMAQDRLWELVKDFVDDRSETTDKVPRSPIMGEWGKKIGDVRISYQGEIIEKAHRLTLDQILPGLPPAGFGASVPLLELCEGEVKERLENAMSNLLPEDEMPDDLPAPKVHSSPEQWELIVKELHARGLVRAVEDPLKVRGRVVTNGAFGVAKPGRFLDDERQVLRFIMDFRGTNSATRIITGDVRTLSGAAALQHVVLPEGKVVRISADDLVAAFYLFSLPRDWSRMMVFSGQVNWTTLGVDRPGKVHVGAAVLPMASAVGVLQHAHRRLALRNPLAGAGLVPEAEIRRDAIFPDLGLGEQAWSLYLDDTNLVEMMDRKVAETLQQKPSAEQERLRMAYQHWGIPVSKDKSLVRAEKGEKLGAVLDGDRGLLKAATRRALETLSLGFWILRQQEVPRKALQIFMGREVHTMQFRRPLFGVFDYLWKDIGDGGAMINLQIKSVEEILLAGMCQPLRSTDLRAKINDVVTASDASESGGGIVYGGKLTSQGIRDLYAAEEEADELPPAGVNLDEPQVTLVFDCFAGIGGLSRALQLARMKVDRLVIVEQDPACRRLNTVRWPGCDVWTDITKVTRKDVERVMRSVPGLTGVIAGGGSPCQGLWQLSSKRLHLEDPRSQLFFKYKEILGWVKEIAKEMKVWCIQMLENVLGDDQDVDEMSSNLGAKPVLACSSGLSRVRRPRLYWSNVVLEDHESYTRAHYDLFDEIIFEEEPEPMEKIPDEGWHWPYGEVDPELRLPTFTRAIPRRRPPPDPAGLSTCNSETVALWQADEMKYPPYTYREEFLFAKTGSSKGTRVASVGERERLMGFPTGYTLALHKKEATSAEELVCQTVAREAALGNSFHAVTVACLLDLWLWTAQVRTDPLGATAIVKAWHEEMGAIRYDTYGLLEVEGFKQLYSHEENAEEERLLSQEKRARRA